MYRICRQSPRKEKEVIKFSVVTYGDHLARASVWGAAHCFASAKMFRE